MDIFQEYDRYDGLGLAELARRKEISPTDWMPFVARFGDEAPLFRLAAPLEWLAPGLTVARRCAGREI